MDAESRPEEKIAANVEQSVPFFGVSNMDASLRFYVDGLGFEMTNKWIVEGRVRWCWLQVGGASLMLQEFARDRAPSGKLGEGVSVCFQCKDALSIYREARSRGLEAKRPFVGNGLWVAGLCDPDGYSISFESPTEVAEETEYSE
jgi:catechol 2,3-dioxygenase-like lactoylglutathione lyase family enzyme